MSHRRTPTPGGARSAVGIVLVLTIATSTAGCTEAQPPSEPEQEQETVEGARRATDRDPCAGLPAGEPFVVATSPRPGSVVSAPIEVSGCSRTFESTVIWRLTRRDGGVAAEGTTSGGGVDGPGPFRFTIESLDASPGLLHLDVSEPVVTEEEGHPPARTVIPLVLEAPV